MTREVTCPACGLVVAAGYPRCPRCRALLPGMTAPPAAVAASRGAAGGTAIADRRRPVLLIVASVIAVVVAVVAVIILMSDDGDERAGAPVPAPSPGLAPAPAQGAEPAPAGEPAADQGVAVAAPSAASLGAELDQRRLWATVAVDGQAAVVHSAYCTDAGMEQAIQAAGADLRAAGLTSVRCHERHGPLVFERPVSAVRIETPAEAAAADAGG